MMKSQFSLAQHFTPCQNPTLTHCRNSELHKIIIRQALAGSLHGRLNMYLLLAANITNYI